MARRSDHTREELRALTLEAAEHLIAEQGVAGLTARALARRIGYTPGTLYLVFSNLDDVILQVNARTLHRLHAPMQKAVSGAADPLDLLKNAARAYVDFARTHPNLWRACFEHRLPPDVAGPDYIDQQIQRLVDLIMQPLQQATGVDHHNIAAAAQALWSGVHGICMLTLTGKLHMMGGQATEHLTDDLVTHYLGGLARPAPLP